MLPAVYQQHQVGLTMQKISTRYRSNLYEGMFAKMTIELRALEIESDELSITDLKLSGNVTIEELIDFLMELPRNEEEINE